VRSVQAKKLLAACVAETSLLSAIYWICCSYALLGHEVDSERRRSVAGPRNPSDTDFGFRIDHPIFIHF
jgi:hypothetical protein